MKSPRKFLRVEDAETPILYWPAKSVLVNFALCTSGLVRSRPKEGSLKLVNILKDARRDDEWGNEVHSLRGEHGLDKSNISNDRDLLTIPGDKLDSYLVHKELEIPDFELPDREGYIQVFHWE